MTYVVIAGCRNYDDYLFFSSRLDLIMSTMDKPITVISGHCRGVDIMAEKYAAERDYQIMLFPAQWQKYGSAAGPIRNKKCRRFVTVL